mmetsp:Transcript_35409/g.140764  ORF Transcript_35409/g.140764 Transcript_35409/m.140764 type:complete len:99 (+) Transcript_35409:245-541(+)
MSMHFVLTAPPFCSLSRFCSLPRPTCSGRWNIEWDFTFDNDALYMTFEGLNESLQEKGKKVTWVGVLNLDEEIEEDEQRLISKQLWDRYEIEEFNNIC